MTLLHDFLEPRFFSALRWWTRGLLVGVALLLVAALYCLFTPVHNPDFSDAPDWYLEAHPLHAPGFFLARLMELPIPLSAGLLPPVVWIGTCAWYSSLGFVIGSLCNRLWLALLLAILIFPLTAELAGLPIIFPMYRGNHLPPPNHGWTMWRAFR